MTTTNRARVLAFLLALAAAGGSGSPSAHAEGDVPFAEVQVHVQHLAERMKDARTGNEDLVASIAAIEASFFRLDPGLQPEAVKAWQEEALDQLFRALTVVRYDARTKENTRNDVNLRAAVALGNLLGSPDLAVHREPKELARLRADRARGLRGAITVAFAKPTGNREYEVPPAVLDATFTALGKTNDRAALEWLLAEYMHTRSGYFEESRLLPAHRAMLLFTNVPGRLRHAIARQVIVSYRGTAAGAADNPAVGKAFWDRIKFGVVELFKHYATGPGGGPPETGKGEVINTIEELHIWWRHHDDPTRAPWLDPKAPK